MHVINCTSSAFDTNFGGIHRVSSSNVCKNRLTRVDLYELTTKDYDFLNILKSKINIKKLMPDLKKTDSQFEVWQNILNEAVNKFLTGRKKGYIAVNNNKPYGILVYTDEHPEYYLDYICTWPVKLGEKVPLGGKTLFKQFFSDFLKDLNAKRITLDAVINGPFDAIAKYKRLGFHSLGGENYYEHMLATKEKIFEVMQELNKLINSKDINNSDNINLLKNLDI